MFVLWASESLFPHNWTQNEDEAPKRFRRNSPSLKS
jgi:hypothetical protein